MGMTLAKLSREAYSVHSALYGQPGAILHLMEINQAACHECGFAERAGVDSRRGKLWVS